ncbi:hypothetical protein SAMN05216243_2676 [Sediminibacillus albus]|uniref:Uncharacterized protein n=1 Tax=Sediminibacillus albus TaxID=407036 RepID=A0A1G9AR95_9BACI|nr:hypothetical protein SAMN05216243_2676 [Sediminibacillus albus]
MFDLWVKGKGYGENNGVNELGTYKKFFHKILIIAFTAGN